MFAVFVFRLYVHLIKLQFRLICAQYYREVCLYFLVIMAFDGYFFSDDHDPHLFFF